MGKNVRGSIFAVTAAILWGTSFVAAKKSVDYMEPFTYNAFRSLSACFMLLAVVLVMNYQKKRKSGNTERKKETGNTESNAGTSTLLVGGLCCGTALFIAMNIQQYGITMTDVGKAGFITALYIVLVPLIGLAIGHGFRKCFVVSLPLALLGLWLLTIKNGFSMGKGDIFVLISAFFYAVHILTAAHFSPKVDGVKMSLIQFVAVTFLSFIGMFLFDDVSMAAVLQAWVPIIYGGAVANGIGFTLQIVAQRDMEPSVVAILLSLEASFAALGGALILHEQLAMRELIGCVLMFAAVIVAQLPEKKQPDIYAKGHKM